MWSRLRSGSCGTNEAGVGDSVEREAQAFPLVEPSAERADTFNAELVKSHRGFGSGGLAGTGAEEHDVAIARDLALARGEGLGREVNRTGQGEGVGQYL
jgi:hypothetical protein